jgi:hypothetical protein
VTLEDKVHALRLHALSRAKELGNVRAACRETGISRTTFHRCKQRFVLYGLDGPHPRQTSARPGRPPQLSPTEKRQILAMALAWPTSGAAPGVAAAGMTRPRRPRCGVPCRVGLGTHVETAPRA